MARASAPPHAGSPTWRSRDHRLSANAVRLDKSPTPQRTDQRQAGGRWRPPLFFLFSRTTRPVAHRPVSPSCAEDAGGPAHSRADDAPMRPWDWRLCHGGNGTPRDGRPSSLPLPRPGRTPPCAPAAAQPPPTHPGSRSLATTPQRRRRQREGDGPFWLAWRVSRGSRPSGGGGAWQAAAPALAALVRRQWRGRRWPRRSGPRASLQTTPAAPPGAVAAQRCRRSRLGLFPAPRLVPVRPHLFPPPPLSPSPRPPFGRLSP